MGDEGTEMEVRVCVEGDRSEGEGGLISLHKVGREVIGVKGRLQ